ncbi:MAG TPA: DUF1501 domain-containing protein [Tepidisphaeraceae bacterium]|jgi:hypothetical protein|nr:DUF1501 domain-containing protein [Tepidisphaeraceae bacterium]
MKSDRPYCDKINRREFMRVGAAGVMGVHLTLPMLLQRQAQAAVNGAAPSDVSVIIVFLMGGPSAIDTFDMKPQAPLDIRGEFRPMATKAPGIQICDLLPRVAGQMDKFSLLRGFTHGNSGHGGADHYMLTGYDTRAGFNPKLTPNNQFPSYGSMIAHKLGPRGSAPPYVCLPMMHNSAGSAYLGASAVPFTIDADPNAPNFAVPDLAPPMALDSHRVENRHELLAHVDRYRRTAEIASNASAREVSTFGQRAVELMTSPSARRAFDIGSESASLRDEYGRTTLGQSCLMARRLVESGVRCVTIDHANWDTHYNNFSVLKTELLPQLDAAMSTLFRDLCDRGMLQKTMVIVTGEFGRTPRINKDAGRDHWSKCFTVCVGGGGIAGGRVVGKSNKWGEEPDEGATGPEDLAATLYHQLGINPAEEIMTPEGRPVAITNRGRIIRELL